jgi:hypothetical protein
VGVIVLLGAGGQRYFDDHVRGTARTLARMHLGPRDLLYFSELIVAPAGEYGRRTRDENVVPLTATRLAEQRELILRDGIGRGGAGAPRVSTYDVREFIY